MKLMKINNIIIKTWKKKVKKKNKILRKLIGRKLQVVYQLKKIIPKN